VDRSVERPELGRTRRAGALMTGLWGIAAALGLYATHAAMPHNPIHLPYERQLQIQLLLPEGWKFFTRDPQDEDLLVLKPAGGAWAAPDNTSNGEAANFFGAARTGRAMFVEAGLLTANVPDWAWKECKEEPTHCLDRLGPALSVVNPNRRPQLCGTVGLARLKPVPWAWASSAHPVVMPSRVLRIEVQC